MSGGGGEEDDTEKQHEPSQKKLDDARRKGDIAKSNDLITTGAYAGLLLAGIVAGAGTVSEAGAVLAGLLWRADDLGAMALQGGGAILMGTLLSEIGMALVPWLALPFVLVIVSAMAQQAIVFSGQKLAPKLNRISPLSNAKNKFGRSGLFEFGKSTVKLVIYSVILFTFLWNRMPQIMGTMALDPGLVSRLLGRLALEFMSLVLAISATIGGIDFLWQRSEHMRKNRMSRKEMTDEHKETEGDPTMKQSRRQRAQEIATNQMMSDVPDASVVIVNPTHYAVALRWDPSSKRAPFCVAKGVDAVALRIRAVAEESGVPIRSDPPTARSLHSITDVGEEIQPEYYAPVAVAIRFAEDMRRKARAR